MFAICHNNNNETAAVRQKSKFTHKYFLNDLAKNDEMMHKISFPSPWLNGLGDSAKH